MIRYAADPGVSKIMGKERKSKNALLNRFQRAEMKINSNPAPVLSLPLEDSLNCIQNLVAKIEKMIKSEYELIENHNILDELEGEVLEPTVELVFAEG